MPPCGTQVVRAELPGNSIKGIRRFIDALRLISNFYIAIYICVFITDSHIAENMGPAVTSNAAAAATAAAAGGTAAVATSAAAGSRFVVASGPRCQLRLSCCGGSCGHPRWKP